MSENLYEGMFLVESGRFAADPDGTAQSITGMIEKAGGTLVSHRPWQDGRLAFPINGQRKGLHYLAYFRMPGTGLKDLNRACRLNDLIMRHLIINQPQTLFDAMVAALSGEWTPQQLVREEEPEVRTPRRRQDADDVPGDDDDEENN
ncbi:MAG: 30S ribosomal protein S6 [Planctomycetaceae bacterium]